jgi:hypothetical protein
VGTESNQHRQVFFVEEFLSRAEAEALIDITGSHGPWAVL